MYLLKRVNTENIFLYIKKKVHFEMHALPQVLNIIISQVISSAKKLFFIILTY